MEERRGGGERREREEMRGRNEDNGRNNVKNYEEAILHVPWLQMK